MALSTREAEWGEHQAGNYYFKLGSTSSFSRKICAAFWALSSSLPATPYLLIPNTLTDPRKAIIEISFVYENSLYSFVLPHKLINMV